MERNNKKGWNFLSNTQNKYSIRKFSVGISSILIGSFIIFGVDNEAHAAEPNNVQNISTNDDNSHNETQITPDQSVNKQDDTNLNSSSKAESKEENDVNANQKETSTPQENNGESNSQSNVEATQPKNSNSAPNTSTRNSKDDQSSDNLTSNQVDSSQPTSERSAIKPRRRVRRDVDNNDIRVEGKLAFSGTDDTEKYYVLPPDITNNRREMNNSFSFTSSGSSIFNDGKLVYEVPKRFIIAEPAFSKSKYVTKKTDLSDADTWRYQFDLRPLTGAAAGEIDISQIVGGMIWSGPGDGDIITSTMKIYQGDTLLDTKETHATFENVKSGLYADRGQTKPTSIWQIPGNTKTTANSEPTIGIIDEDGTISDKSDDYIYQVPFPSDHYFLENDNVTTTSRDYSRYTDFTYSILNIPSWLELDPNPNINNNKLWTQDENGIHLHLSEGQNLSNTAYTPTLKLKKSAVTPEILQKFKDDGFINVNLIWKTVGRLPNGQDYIQSLPADDGIKFKMINQHGIPTGHVALRSLRTLDPSRLFTKADHQHETFRILKYLTDRDRSNKYAPTYMHSIQIPKGQDGDYFTKFDFNLSYIKYFQGKYDKYAGNSITLKEPFILYGVNSDGSTTKLAEWKEINKTNKTYEFGDKCYNHLVLQTPVIRDTVTPEGASEKDIYGWGTEVTYAVGEKRWQDAAKDDNVTKMQNTLIVDQVPENTVEAASAVPTRGLSDELSNPGNSYIHTKDLFPHTLIKPVLKNTNGFQGNLLNYNDKANVIIKANTSDYLKYLSTDVTNNRSDIDNNRLDNIKNVYLSLNAPDGTAISNVRIWTNNDLIRNASDLDSGFIENSPTSTLKDRPVIDPIKVIPNYKESGRTLYIYKVPEGYDWNKTLPDSRNLIFTKDTPEMTFDIFNRGTLPSGSYSIRYATIWDKNSELVRPIENQTLDRNHIDLSDVITDDLSSLTDDNRVSVIDVPFTIALAKEFASSLTIGKDAKDSFDRSLVGVGLGESVNLQTTTINFTNNVGILKEIMVTIPKDNVETTLTELIPNTDKYHVVYTTDSDVTNGTYTTAPTDLTKVTAVKYIFNTTLLVNRGEIFNNNIKITVPVDAPILTKAHSQIFTRGTDDVWLAGNKVELETEDNRGKLVVRYTDEAGKNVQDNTSSIGVKNTKYKVDIPQMINSQGHHYKFLRIDNQFDPVIGYYEKKQTKVVHLIYNEVLEGSVFADFKTTDGEVLSPQITVLDHQLEGTHYTTTAPTFADKVKYEENKNGRVKKTIHYRLVAVPKNQSGEVIGNQDIYVHYVYEPVTTYELVPNNPPQTDKPQLKVTRYIDRHGRDIIKPKKGKHKPYPNIPGGWIYTGIVEEHDGITTYIYEKVKHHPTPKCKKVNPPVKRHETPSMKHHVKVSSPVKKEQVSKEKTHSTHHKVELPETGKSEGNTTLFASILLALGSIFMFRKKDRTSKTK
ncbi:YSIRK-type signal peptide-containing protein [Staphylococcus devriesei]|uniref:YSIRK-type signal peptide-containing protein n=2 Tax=Staphylococcus devriesei TaxID=586733 RepID=UPI000E69FC32|nr:YSIRK-type signal peptide-containing protein [Staphylococcus devriesei]RIL71312.1 YSIRK-type signal peptide-containing protein [Staphylococcus devriesei]